MFDYGEERGTGCLTGYCGRVKREKLEIERIVVVKFE